jgi:hypothetical protein
MAEASEGFGSFEKSPLEEVRPQSRRTEKYGAITIGFVEAYDAQFSSRPTEIKKGRQKNLAAWVLWLLEQGSIGDGSLFRRCGLFVAETAYNPESAGKPWGIKPASCYLDCDAEIWTTSLSLPVQLLMCPPYPGQVELSSFSLLITRIFALRITQLIGNRSGSSGTRF